MRGMKRAHFYRCRTCWRSSLKPYSACPHCLTVTVGEYVVEKKQRVPKQESLL